MKFKPVTDLRLEARVPMSSNTRVLVSVGGPLYTYVKRENWWDFSDSDFVLSGDRYYIIILGLMSVLYKPIYIKMKTKEINKSSTY